MTKPLAALIAATFALFAGSVALACSCVRYANAAEHAAQAETMFVGRVLTSTPAEGLRSTTRFTVLETLKGEASGEIDVIHVDERGAGATCGIGYTAGQEVLVIASTSARGLVTSSCSAPRWPIEEYRAALNR